MTGVQTCALPISTLQMRWPKFWSFSLSISPSNEHLGLISFRMDWLDLLAIQGIPKSLLLTVQKPHLSIITLNVNGLNAPTKRQKLAEWIQKQDPYVCCLQKTYLKPRDTYRMKVKGSKKTFHTNGDQKKAGVAIFISDKIDF